MERRIKLGRWGLAEDIRDAIVTMPWQGRQLLGRVNRFEPGNRSETTGAYRLNVDHFCGDPWPLKPACSAVRILE